MNTYQQGNGFGFGNEKMDLNERRHWMEMWNWLNLMDWGPEKAMAPHSNTLAWKISWTEEPGRLQAMGSQRVGQDWATSLSLFTFMHWRRNCQPTPVFLPGESQGRGSLVAAIYGVAQSRTWMKRLSGSKFFMAFLPKSKHLLISWLWSPSAVFSCSRKEICHCFYFLPMYLQLSD